MSVRMISRVWDFSAQKGNDLLMLLAIADFADDDGNAYPAVSTLATKCRMKPRNANLILAALKASGELEVRLNEGPNGTNRYRIILPGSSLQVYTGVQKSTDCRNMYLTPVETYPKPLQVSTDKPSVNHQEPSTRSDDDAFATFWERYPKKVAKPQAMKAWKKLKPSKRLLDELMAGLQRQKASIGWQKDGGQFIPHPATWINARRWEDAESQSTVTGSSTAPNLPQPGAVRQRHGVPERFDEVAGWVPA